MEKLVKACKIYIGPMSKNVVDGVIKFANYSGKPIGLVASRRQVDYKGGYANGWTTAEFVKYVKEQNNNIIVCRDHGGVGQGASYDDGILSFLEDKSFMDIIHIDPWKKYDFDKAVEYTIRVISKCVSDTTNCLFEIGTEEAIYSMSSEQLDSFISKIKAELPEHFDKVVYAVIQSGTSLKSGTNTGVYSKERLISMVEVCKKHGLLSKEHNGDYLTGALIQEKFSLGLDAINIAPELANIESEIILNSINKTQKLWWYDLCIKDGQWYKWFPEGFDPSINKDEVLRLCGHYVFSLKEFDEVCDLHAINSVVASKICAFIEERIPNE